MFQYFKKFGDKPCCFTDLKVFVDLLPPSQYTKVRNIKKCWQELQWLFALWSLYLKIPVDHIKRLETSNFYFLFEIQELFVM